MIRRVGLSVMRSVAVLILFEYFCEPLCAEGMRNPPTGAQAISMIGGRFLAVDDLTAITQNPARLADLDAPASEICLTAGYAKTKYSSLSGEAAVSDDPWAYLPAFYAAVPLKEIQCVAGLGVDVPFGRSTAWSGSGLFRYAAPYYTQLQTINANPTIAGRISDSLSIGAGFDIMRADVDYRQYFPWAMAGGSPTDPDGDIRLKAAGYGYGGNIALAWRATGRQQFALTYRSPMSVDFDGSASVQPVAPAGAAAGITPRSDFSTGINFPAVIAAGYRVGLTDSIHVEADVEWIGSSSFKGLTLDAGNNSALFRQAAPGNPPELPQNWSDTHTIGMGVDWQFSPEWNFRAGWIYLESPVPDNTFSPSMPDANELVLSSGFGYKHGRHSVDLAYAAGLFEGREIRDNNNPAYNGSYDFSSHLLSVSYEYTF